MAIRNAIREFVQGKIVPAIPSGVKMNPALRYLHSKVLYHRLPHEGDSILLYTQYKSGTHLFRFLLTNYLMIHFQGRTEPVTYDELEVLFPNSTDYLVAGAKSYQAPHPVIREAGYSDFYCGHHQGGIEFSPARIVALYRNPLDFLVSNYHYRYKNRDGVTDAPDSADGTVDEELPYLIKTYSLLDRLERKDNVLTLAYEDLMRAPVEVFAVTVRWLGLPLDMGHIHKAVEFSSFKRVQEYEDQHGPIVAGKGFSGRFARSGKIGQWRDELSPETVRYVEERLKEAGVPMARFVTE